MKHALLRLGPSTALPSPCFPSLRFSLSVCLPPQTRRATPQPQLESAVSDVLSHPWIQRRVLTSTSSTTHCPGPGSISQILPQVNSSELREGRRPESVPKMTNSLECSFRLEPYHGDATHKGGLIGRWNKAHNVTAWRTEGLHGMMERLEQRRSRASTDKLERL